MSCVTISSVWKNSKHSIRFCSLRVGVPEEAGLLLDVIRTYAGKKPILGVCLGEQAIGEVYGAQLSNLDTVFHGIQSPVTVSVPDYLFEGLPQRFPVGRYHSWVVDRKDLPDCLEVTATSDEGYIMALRHQTLDVRECSFIRVRTDSRRKTADRQLAPSLNSPATLSNKP